MHDVYNISASYNKLTRQIDRSYTHWLEEARKPVSEQQCPASSRAAEFYRRIVGK